MSRRQWPIEKALKPSPSIAMSPGGSSAELSCVSRRHCRHHPHWPWPRRSAARPDGIPRSWAGLRMSPTYQFEHTNGFRAQRFRCPLLFPTRTGQTCKHAQFVRGPGCVKDPNWEKGGLMRALLNRDGPLYKAVYTQRTCYERINSQAKNLGIERPKARNIRAHAQAGQIRLAAFWRSSQVAAPLSSALRFEHRGTSCCTPTPMWLHSLTGSVLRHLSTLPVSY